MKPAGMAILLFKMLGLKRILFDKTMLTTYKKRLSEGSPRFQGFKTGEVLNNSIQFERARRSTGLDRYTRPG
jgi:hypothetical protein